MKYTFKLFGAFAVTLISFGSLAGQTSAATMALTSTGGQTDGNTNITMGFSFTVTSDIIVTHLGVFDRNEDGLVESREVGLWRNSDQALLASITIASGTGSPLTSGFRFESTPAVVLFAGEQYSVAAQYNSGNDKLFQNNPTFDSNIEIISRTVFVSGSSLSFPSGNDGQFRATTNFMFTSIPEPSSALLLCLSGLGLVIRRHRIK